MKKLEIVIRVERLDVVREALERLGCPGMMVTRIEGHGKQKGVVHQFRGREYHLELLPKYKIEIVADDADVARIVAGVTDVARTGEVGDGKIFISTIDDVVRIRTGEAGAVAI